jgi:leucyl-tRNA synthetase
LANDQVVDGRCERCETEIIQKKHPQWYIKITDYADQLLDYSDCDRPEETKIHQTNWIGKSKGAEISFMIADDRGMIADDDKSKANSDLTYKIIGCAYKVHKELGS